MQTNIQNNKYLEEIFHKLLDKFKEQDEKFDKKFKEFDKKFDKKFKEFDKKFDKKFKELDKKFDEKFDQQFKKIDEKFDQQFKKIDEKFDQQFKKIDKLNGKLNEFNTTIKELNSNFKNINCFFEGNIADEIHEHLETKYNNKSKNTDLIYKKLYLKDFKNYDDYNYFEFPKKIEKNKKTLIEFDEIGILIPSKLYNMNYKDSLFYKYPPDLNNSSNKKYLVIIESKMTLKTKKEQIEEINTQINEKFDKIQNFKDFLKKCEEFYNLIENKNVIKNKLSKIKDINNLNMEKVLNEYKNPTSIGLNNDEKILLGYLLTNYSGCQIALKFNMKFDYDNIKLYIGARSIETTVLNYDIIKGVMRDTWFNSFLIPGNQTFTV